MASKVTLASLDQKLESFMELVKEHMDRTSYVLDGNGKPGLKTRIEVNEKDIEDIKESRSMHLKAVWSTITVVAGAVLLSFIKGH